MGSYLIVESPLEYLRRKIKLRCPHSATTETDWKFAQILWKLAVRNVRPKMLGNFPNLPDSVEPGSAYDLRRKKAISLTGFCGAWIDGQAILKDNLTFTIDASI